MEKKALLIFLSIALLTACTAAQLQAGAGALGATATQLLCAESKAAEKGITVEEALETLCATEDQWAPWKEPAARARADGARAAK